MVGRPRKPTHLKIVQGTERNHRANPNEPKPQRGAAPPPEWLSGRASEIYAGICAQLDGMGVLSTVDDNIVALAASRLEEVEITTASIEDGGRTYNTRNATGEKMIRPNPMVSQRSEAMRHAHALLSELGLTPAARSKVSSTKTGETNPFKALMGAG